MALQLPSPLQVVNWSILNEFDVSLYIKRDDLIHTAISGNKWRKLKFNIEKFKRGKYAALLTFGGAFSNHIAATAFAGKLLNIPTIGIIRGEELNSESNDTLKTAQKNGMQLHFVSREKYKERHERLFWEELRSMYGHILIVPEGGANFLGMIGCSELLAEIAFQPDYIVTAAGTGTTAAGLLFNAKKMQVVAVSALKNGHFLMDDIKELFYYAGFTNEDIADKMKSLTLETGYHFGGYGKSTNELLDFMNTFYQETGLVLDHVYTAKMVYAFKDKLVKGHFKQGSKIVLLHTGGLQGNNSVLENLAF